MADNELTAIQALSDDDIVGNILTRDIEDNDVEEQETLSYFTMSYLNSSTYFACHDIDTYLQQQVINIEDKIDDDYYKTRRKKSRIILEVSKNSKQRSI